MEYVGRNVAFILDRDVFGRKTSKKVIGEGYVKSITEKGNYKIEIEKPENLRKERKYIVVRPTSILKII